MSPRPAIRIPCLVILKLLLLGGQASPSAAQSKETASLLSQAQAVSGVDDNGTLSRSQVLSLFGASQSQPQKPSVTTKEIASSELAVKVWICPAVMNGANEGQEEVQVWKPGNPVNPEEFKWEPGQVFFVRIEVSKPAYVNLFYIKMGDTPKLFSPDPAYPQTFAPLPVGKIWTSPPIALDNDTVPEVLDWIVVTDALGLLGQGGGVANLEIEVAVRAFLQSATGKPQAMASADAQARLIDKDNSHELGGRITQASKIIYGKTKDLPSTKMGYVLPLDGDVALKRDDFAVLGYGPEGIAHGLLLFNKTTEER